MALAVAGVGALTLSVPAAMAANPCAAKNPCAASNKVDPKLVTRTAGTMLYAGMSAELLKEGERLWSSPKLPTNGLTCATCHAGRNSFGASFAQPYPHAVEMAQERGGMKTIALDEMVQFCIVAPLAGKPLALDSKDMAALTAYTAHVQKDFVMAKGAAKNPCAAKK